jgi:hypothetical protein
MSNIADFSWFDHPNSTWLRTNIIKLLILQFFYCLLLSGFRCSPQQPLFRHPLFLLRWIGHFIPRDMNIYEQYIKMGTFENGNETSGSTKGQESDYFSLSQLLRKKSTPFGYLRLCKQCIINLTVKWLTLLFHFREVPYSNIVLETGYRFIVPFHNLAIISK